MIRHWSFDCKSFLPEKAFVLIDKMPKNGKSLEIVFPVNYPEHKFCCDLKSHEVILTLFEGDKVIKRHVLNSAICFSMSYHENVKEFKTIWTFKSMQGNYWLNGSFSNDSQRK